jgi:hypothetical protein
MDYNIDENRSVTTQKIQILILKKQKPENSSDKPKKPSDKLVD